MHPIFFALVRKIDSFFCLPREKSVFDIVVVVAVVIDIAVVVVVVVVVVVFVIVFVVVIVAVVVVVDNRTVASAAAHTCYLFCDVRRDGEKDNIEC